MKNHKQHFPVGPWAFDVAVADVFPSMARRSIPGYLGVQDLVIDAAQRLPPGSSVLDIGCATGETLAALESLGRDLVLVGIEPSWPMAQQAFRATRNATIVRKDLLHGLSDRSTPFDLICCLWTLQFMTPQERAASWGLIGRLLQRGSTILLAEKTRQTDEQREQFHAWKHTVGGYSWAEINAKAASLDGVLLSRAAEEIEEEARRAHIDMRRVPSTGDVFGFLVWQGTSIKPLIEDLY
jgi:tRNA (cmo5U34)-methyltransferase